MTYKELLDTISEMLAFGDIDILDEVEPEKIQEQAEIMREGWK